LIACSLFEHQIAIFDAGDPPPSPTVEPLSARAWPSRQPHALTARVVEDLNGSLEKSLSDLAPFIGLFYEQRKDVTAAWISDGKEAGILSARQAKGRSKRTAAATARNLCVFNSPATRYGTIA
jgi:hypothetical protein